MNSDFSKLMNMELFPIAGQTIHVSSLVLALVVLLLGWALSRAVDWTVRRALNRRLSAHEGGVRATGRLVRYLVLAGTLAAALNVLGINISSLFAAGAIFAVGIGFAMQNIAQNFVSGVILLVERSIKPGDVLHVEGRFVTVTHMGIRATVARTPDEEEIIIPNSSLVQSSVINFTMSDPVLRLRAQVGVSYDSDMRQVRRVLEECAAKFTPQVKDPEPVVVLLDFGDSAVVWEVSVYIPSPSNAFALRGQLRELVWFALKDAHITIAFPQLDVHFDGERAPLSLAWPPDVAGPRPGNASSSTP